MGVTGGMLVFDLAPPAAAMECYWRTVLGKIGTSRDATFFLIVLDVS